MAAGTSGARAGTTRSIHVEVPTRRGVRLAGTLDVRGGVGDEGLTGVPTAVVAHCFTCNRTSPGVARISKTLARHGWASLRIDFAGLGQSEGDFAESSLDTNVEDVVAASEWLAGQGAGPSLLVGHSLGGSAVLSAASRIDEVKAVATVGAPFDPRHAAATIPEVVKVLGQRVEELTHKRDGETGGTGERDEATGTELSVELPSRPIRIGAPLLESLAAYDPESVLAEVDAALLFLHSPFDQTVAFRDALRLFEAADQPASLLSVPEVDHLLTWRGAGKRVGELIAAWAEGL